MQRGLLESVHRAWKSCYQVGMLEKLILLASCCVSVHACVCVWGLCVCAHAHVRVLLWEAREGVDEHWFISPGANPLERVKGPEVITKWLLAFCSLRNVFSKNQSF